jgi:hypothetical protein
MHIKPTKTFKMPKALKRMLALHRGNVHEKGAIKNILIQSVLTEQMFKNSRAKSEKFEGGAQ